MSSLLTVLIATVCGGCVAVAWLRARENSRRPGTRIHDQARLAATAAAAAVAAQTDPLLDDVCTDVRSETGWDMAFVTAVGADRVHAIGRAGMPDDLTDMPTRDSLCAIVAAREEPVVIRRAELAAMVLGGCVAGRTVARYVGVPVRRSGEVIGALAVSQTGGHAERDTSDDQVVRTLQRHALRVEAVVAHQP